MPAITKNFIILDVKFSYDFKRNLHMYQDFLVYYINKEQRPIPSLIFEEKELEKGKRKMLKDSS
jgi:hypothetical protein